MTEMVRYSSSRLYYKCLSKWCTDSDALLPCGPCVKSHAYNRKVNPTTTPEEPDCHYDSPEDIAEGNKAKITRLEARIGTLSSHRHPLIIVLRTTA